MNKAERQFYTWCLRIAGTIIVVVWAYYISQAFFTSAIGNNVSPNVAYGGAIGIFAIILAVWIGKLAVRFRLDEVTLGGGKVPG